MRKEEPRNEDASDGDEREGRRVRRARNAGIVLVATFAPESRLHRTRRSRVLLRSRPARPAVVSTLTPRRRGVLTPRRRGVLTPPRVSSILSVGGQLVLAFLCFPSPTSLDVSRFPSSAPRKSTTRLLASYPCGANTSPCANPSTHNTSAASRANRCVAIASGSRMASLECITASARAGMSSAHAHTPNTKTADAAPPCTRARAMHQSRASVKANRDTDPARSRHDDAKSPRGRRRAPPDPRRRRAWRRRRPCRAGGAQPPHLPPPVLELTQNLATTVSIRHAATGSTSIAAATRARWRRGDGRRPSVPRARRQPVDDTNPPPRPRARPGSTRGAPAQGNLGKAHERDGTVRTRAEDVRDGPQVRGRPTPRP